MRQVVRTGNAGVVCVLALAGVFLVLDIIFVSANVHKIPAGGWFPLRVHVDLDAVLASRPRRNIQSRPCTRICPDRKSASTRSWPERGHPLTTS